ncbi:MAG: AbrB/MazE/SpoVT family DNA-binding domain-containing protein [Limnohabitans sp.]|nr:AbrB/MazE/SpoVT family DNA-binding domain-containing protein [Limnohabitans sp.]
MHIAIRPFGNSRGIVIPKTLLTQLGLEDAAEVSVENDSLVIRKPSQAPRSGWGDAAKALAQANDDVLVMGDFGNEVDEDLKW